MTDEQETYATRAIALPTEFDGELLEIPPSTGWVVHRVQAASQAQSRREMWAWCKVAEDAPGYSEIVVTLADGVTHADPGPGFQLGPVIVKVFC